jgi:beta-galactosidase GanA
MPVKPLSAIRAFWRIVLMLLATAGLSLSQPSKDLQELFSPDHAAQVWRSVHCDLRTSTSGALSATFWKGYQNTGLETSQLPFGDWSSWRSFRLEVENQNREPMSVYVRLSNRTDHPGVETYTGGTFDGFVIGPGHSSLEISIQNMQSPEGHAIDPKRIAWLGIFVQPLFLRDGMELKFKEDQTLRFSLPRLSSEPATVQKQPYGDLLFRETELSSQTQRAQVEKGLENLQNTIAEARRQGIETAYAEMYPFLSQIAFHSRLVAFWQNRAEEQQRVLRFLAEGIQQAGSQLQAVLAGKSPRSSVPAVPDYGRLAIKDGYFRFGDQPVLLFGMLYNHEGPLLRWFANSETDYGTELVAGGTRHDVERQPIWSAYQRYPDTHRVGWPHADHIIRDSESWEVLGPPVSVCLESPHSREAIAAAIEKFEQNAPREHHLVQNMGFEYTYVCYCEYTRRLWADWLRRKYSNVDTANRTWGTRFAGFSSVTMPHPQDWAANRALWFDWSSFNVYRFLEQIRWTRDQIRRWRPNERLTVGSPYYAFSPAFWTGVDEEELADSGITGVVLEENYALDTLMPEYLHALANGKPVADFEYHGVVHQILPSFLHGDAAISMWWWNDAMHWTPNEPINEWTTSFPQSYTIPLSDIAKAMRDALDLRRLGREIAALGSAPRQVALLYSKTSMLQQSPDESDESETTPYLSELRRLYKAAQSTGLYVGLTTEKKILSGDLRRRKILALTSVRYLPQSVIGEIMRWVEAGGTLIVSPDSLVGDEYARPFQGARLPGVRVTRTEPPQLKRGETVVTEYNREDLPRMRFSAGGRALEAAGVRQWVECRPEDIIARFADGGPAIVRLRRGSGTVYWLTAPLVSEGWAQFLSFASAQSGLEPELSITSEGGQGASSVEYRLTSFERGRLAYIYNNSDQDLRLLLRPRFSFTTVLNLRTGTPVVNAPMFLPARETALLEFR